MCKKAVKMCRGRNKRGYSSFPRVETLFVFLCGCWKKLQHMKAIALPSPNDRWDWLQQTPTVESAGEAVTGNDGFSISLLVFCQRGKKRKETIIYTQKNRTFAPWTLKNNLASATLSM